MKSKKEIIQSVEYIFENTKRIHGNSDVIDWQKIAIHKSVSYILSELVPLPLDVPTDKEIEGEAMSYSSYPAMPDGHPEFNIIQANDFDAGAKWAIKQIIERNQK